MFEHRKLSNDFVKTERDVMGGYGSGRRGVGRYKAEECRMLDVNQLHRAGALKVGRWSGLLWTRDGERVASIRLQAEKENITVSYRIRVGDGDWEDVSETVDIDRVPCRFGGRRPYFICPGIVNGDFCRRRVAKLYGPGRYFLCRHCYRLTHASQGEGLCDRARRRASKIRARLGGDPGGTCPLPSKPRGMWRRTYERVCNAAIEAEMLANQAFVIEAQRLVSRIDRRRQRIFWK
jgi:hypothetical protein